MTLYVQIQATLALRYPLIFSTDQKMATEEKQPEMVIL
jgi:hypothetical protein